MILKSITFSKYRCFLDGSISFVSSSERKKNITLIIGPNGSGKTELLFAFWWVLYGAKSFDFKSLTGKEATPYALNSELYRKLQQNGLTSGSETCSVRLIFEYKNCDYEVSRTTEFKKTPVRENLSEEDLVRISITNLKTGVAKTPYVGEELCERLLNKIIPKKVLHGIIFDGERMQSISSLDKKSVEAVEGIISDITNRDRIQATIIELDRLKRVFNKEIRIQAGLTHDEKLEQVSKELEKVSNNIDVNKMKIDELKSSLEDKNKELQKVNDELARFATTKKLQMEKATVDNALNLVETEIERDVQDLAAELNLNGYLYATGHLFDQAKKQIDQYDVPVGLTTEAVRSIMKRNDCICGSKISDDNLKKLESLLVNLPPDNLNSLLSEKIRNLQSRSIESGERAETHRTKFLNKEKKLQEYREKIVELNDMIRKQPEGKDPSVQRDALIVEIGVASNMLDVLNRDNFELINDKESLEQERRKLSEKTAATKLISKKMDFISRSLEALEIIQGEHTKDALLEINDLLKKAYNEVSEDATQGRDVHIVQFHEKDKYKILVFYKKDVEKYLKAKSADPSDLAIFEEAVLANAINSSTGQGKGVAIAFVKAMLDYSNGKREEGDFEQTKDYPVVIDAPFGDLDGDNLSLAARMIHLFSCQVLLFLTEKSFSMVQEHITEDIGVKYMFKKTSDKNYSKISLN